LNVACTIFSIPLFSYCVTNDCPPLSKNNRNHHVKALDKKRGDASLLKEDAEDGISAFISPLTRRNTA